VAGHDGAQHRRLAIAQLDGRPRASPGAHGHGTLRNGSENLWQGLTPSDPDVNAASGGTASASEARREAQAAGARREGDRSPTHGRARPGGPADRRPQKNSAKTLSESRRPRAVSRRSPAASSARRPWSTSRAISSAKKARGGAPNSAANAPAAR